LRSDPAALLDAVKAIGFFPGPRAVLVEEATDGLAEVIAAAITEWRQGDAAIVVTGGALEAKSTLRKLFEGSPAAVSVVLYDEPLSPDEIGTRLAEAGLVRVGSEAKAAILALGRTLDPGDFRQTVEKLGLYKMGDAGEVTFADVQACAPISVEAETDELMQLLGDGRSGEIAGVLRRLYAQGVGPVAICIAAIRHFRALHQIASATGGPAEGLGRMRPPVWGPRRDALLRQAQAWGVEPLEKAIMQLLDTDLKLRSALTSPGHALVERTLLRIAMTTPR
jgi:DNA polymerase-3 subunit delta